MTIMFSFGKYGGFYFSRGFTWRLCLGWMAITLIPSDDDILLKTVKEKVDDDPSCPFCGGRNLEVNYSYIDGWIARVDCKDCDDIRGPSSKFKYQNKESAEQDPLEQWSRRVKMNAKVE